MATISDVAAHARVGLGTVSRVLNNSPKVSESTRGALEGRQAHHAGVRELPLELVVRTTTAAPKAA